MNLSLSEHFKARAGERSQISQKFEREARRIEKNIEAQKRKHEWQKYQKLAYKAMELIIEASVNGLEKSRKAAMKAEIDLLNSKSLDPESEARREQSIKAIKSGKRRICFTCQYWGGE